MNQDLRNRTAELIIVITVLAAAWFVLVQPLSVRADKAETRVRSLEAELEAYQSMSDLQPEQARRHLARVGKLIAIAEPRTALAQHEHILDLAKTSGIKVARINPASDDAPSRIGPVITGSRRFHIESSGTFTDIAEFLSALSTQTPMAVVDHFSVNAPNPSDPDDLHLTASIKVGQFSTQRFDVAEVEP